MSDLCEETAFQIVERLRAKGFVAYLAGGCVRDRLLGLKAQDYDVATNARPEIVQGLFDSTVGFGARFGVIMVLIGDYYYEVATFRADAAYHDGRRPSAVTFGTIEEDAHRRDFTINGMYYDPATDRTIDLVGGRHDLRAGLVRAIGDPAERFKEDHLRLLRAVRFSARLGFPIESATWDAMRHEAPSLARIAAERIGDELVKILVEGGAARGLDLLVASGLAAVVLPEVLPLASCPQPANFHPEGDVYRHTRLMLSMLPAGCSETLAFGVLFHDIAKPACFAIDETGKMSYYGHTEQGATMAVAALDRLRRSRATQERVRYLVRDHLRMINAPQMRQATLKRMVTEEGFDELLELSRIDTLASSSNLGFYHFCRRALMKAAEVEIRPPRLLGGNDLMALGLTPGPSFKHILREVEDLQLDGALTTHEEAVTYVREHYLQSSSVD